MRPLPATLISMDCDATFALLPVGIAIEHATRENMTQLGCGKLLPGWHCVYVNVGIPVSSGYHETSVASYQGRPQRY